MKNKANFLSEIKEEIFQSNNYDSKIADLKKQKDETNKAVKNYISENKAMFKKRRLIDMFTGRFLGVSALLSCSVFMVSLFTIGVFNESSLMLSINWIFLSLSTVFFNFFLILIDCENRRIPKGKKAKFMSKLKFLYKDRRKIMASLKNIKNEKENISKAIENFDSNNNDDNERLLSLPVKSDFLKILPLYFSEKDIEKMMYAKKNNYLSYYDVIKFMSKIENKSEIKKQAEHIVNMSRVECFY